MAVRHIGVTYALCSRKIAASLRDDLGVDRYRRLGVSERFRDEAPYRICARCIRVLEARNPLWRRDRPATPKGATR